MPSGSPYLTISPAAVWRTRIPRYRLVGYECKKCGRRHYPPRPACPYCGSTELVEVELPRTGVVETYSIVYSTPDGYRRATPVITAIVRLDDGTRVATALTDVLPEEVHTGMKVEAVFRKLREDQGHGLIEYGVKFRPVLVPRNGRGEEERA